MKTRLWFALLLSVVATYVMAAENKPDATGSSSVAAPVKDEKSEIKPLKPFNCEELELTFSLKGSQFAYGEPIQGQVTLKCIAYGGSLRLYNPFFHACEPKPGNVRIFSKAGTLVATLIDDCLVHGCTHTCWIVPDKGMSVRPGDFVGTQISDLPRGGWLSNRIQLALGEYSAQFVLYSYAVRGADACRFDLDKLTGSSTQEYRDYVAGKAVIAASELIPFKIVDKASGGAATSGQTPG